MTAIHAHQDYLRVLILAVSDHRLRMIVRDITDALRHRYVGTISAARAVDGICKYFVPDGGTRKDGWPVMREALNITEGYAKSITKISEGPRHAEWDKIPESEARETMERAWILLNRFLELKKRGVQSLPLSEFPLLDVSQV